MKLKERPKLAREIKVDIKSTAMEEFLPHDVATEEGLQLAALAYQEYDQREKEAKKVKDTARTALMRLMTQAVREEALTHSQQISADISAVEDMGGPAAWLAHFFPGWIIDKLETDGDRYSLTISEDPDLIKYDFEVGGYHFGRTVAFKGADFRAAEFYESLADVQDDALYDDLESCVSVSYEPTYAVNEEKMQAVMVTRPGEMHRFKKFMYPGKLEVRMLPIGKAKNE